MTDLGLCLTSLCLQNYEDFMMFASFSQRNIENTIHSYILHVAIDISAIYGMYRCQELLYVYTFFLYNRIVFVYLFILIYWVSVCFTLTSNIETNCFSH